MLTALLDICVQSQAAQCLVDHAPRFAEAAERAAAASPAQSLDLARQAQFYIDYARYLAAPAQTYRQILAGPAWRRESPANAALYLRRQLLGANLSLELDDAVAVDDRANRILSLIAALKNPEESRFYVAYALSEVIANLLSIGETERAYGLYVAAGEMIAKALPPLTVDAVSFRITEARLLQEVGDLKGSRRALEAATGAIPQMELDELSRDGLLANALTLRAVMCAADGETACARASIAQHPFASRFAVRPSKPESYEETAYLAARVLVNAGEGIDDPVAAESLKAPLGFEAVPSLVRVAEAYRAAGVALATPAGKARQAALMELGRRGVDAAARQPKGVFGSWHRPGAVDRIMIEMALSQIDGRLSASEAETVFALFQLAGRRGPSFDSDALTVLGQGRSELQRRAIHQALRLRARRDRLERAEVQHAALRAISARPKGEPLRHDAGERLLLRDFNQRISEAQASLAGDGISVSGANLAPLKAFQAALAPNEAALAVQPLGRDAVAYMCVRRDSARQTVAPADLARARLDTRLVQAALTAGHAPSEELDAQFPAEAAVRLYDVLMRPFEACLKPGDHIIWLPGVTSVSLPLSVLLRQAPPRLGEGYDLAAADWLVRRHAITYAGAASVITASRASRRGAADFDFLGVGDPLLDGQGAAAEVSSLAALPETRDELQQSAQGFGHARLLLGAGATEGRLRGELVGAYRFLSFATHGLIREDLQGLSEPALVLTPTTGAGGDGLLTASEIADLSLAARFVALSACNTANYDLTQFSQDLPSLASAFAIAGVPATLATLWPVESETSKRVTAAVFARLRVSPRLGAAEALAAAQRDFLAAPPGRAYLHPRFWAPFVVLGDGGEPAPAVASETAITSVEVLTTGGGSVLAMDRSGGGLAMRLAARSADGRRVAAARMSQPGGETWRRDNPDVLAAPLALELGSRIVVGGRAITAQDRLEPTLEAFDRKTGEPAHAWQGAAPPQMDGFILSGVRLDSSRAAVAVAEMDLKGRPSLDEAMRIRVFEIDEAAAPRLLFDVDARTGGAGPSLATLIPMGAGMLVTYTDMSTPSGSQLGSAEDYYDSRFCASQPATWLELRDLRTGALRATRTLKGYVFTAVLAVDGRTMLGGSYRAGCSEDAKAVVLSVDEALKLETLFQDRSSGGSEVKALSRAHEGVFVAAAKENIFDFGEPEVVGAALRRRQGAMLFHLPKGGGVPSLKMLDAGSNIVLTAVEASEPGDILVAGAVGGEAAVIHLAGRPAGR